MGKEVTKQQMRIDSDFYGSIKRCTCQSVGVFGTKGYVPQRFEYTPNLSPNPKAL